MVGKVFVEKTEQNIIPQKVRHKLTICITFIISIYAGEKSSLLSQYNDSRMKKDETVTKTNMLSIRTT